MRGDNKLVGPVDALEGRAATQRDPRWAGGTGQQQCNEIKQEQMQSPALGKEELLAAAQVGLPDWGAALLLRGTGGLGGSELSMSLQCAPLKGHPGQESHKNSQWAEESDHPHLLSPGETTSRYCVQFRAQQDKKGNDQLEGVQQSTAKMVEG